jgi:sirohydrochlorin ferrochelatase
MDDLIAERIRALDDHLRKNPTADVAIMTPGIAALGREAFDRIMKNITAMADICHDYEPDEDQHIGSFPSEADLSRSRSTTMSARPGPSNGPARPTAFASSP